MLVPMRIFLLFILLFMSASFALTNCSIINSPGIYTLTNDAIGSLQTGDSHVPFACMIINSNDVSLDCLGFSISDNGTTLRHAGVFLNSSFNNISVKNCNILTQYNYSIYVQNTTNAIFSNNIMNGSYGAAANVVNSTNVSFIGNSVSNFTFDGFRATNSSNLIFSINNISNATALFYGFLLQNITSSNLSNNSLISGANGTGFSVYLSDNLKLENNSVYNISIGYDLLTSSNIYLFGNKGNYSEEDMYDFASISNLSVLNNSAINCGNGDDYSCYDFMYCSNASASHNFGSTATYSSIRIFSTDDFNLSSNLAVNSFVGVEISSSMNSSVLSNNISHNNNGIYASDSYGILLVDNRLSDSNENLVLETSSGTSIKNLFNNSSINVHLFYSDLIQDSDYFSKSILSSLLLESNPITSSTLNATNIIFDSPSGGYSNFTNLSINVTLPIGLLSFGMNWSNEPSPLPTGLTSFNGKFLNMSNISGLINISSIVWHWISPEVAGKNESTFNLYKYNGTNWILLNSTPDIVMNSLSQTDLSNFSIFALLYNNSTTDLPPNVSLLNPSNGTTLASSSGIFSFNASDDYSSLLNCSLYLDNVKVANNSTTMNSTQTSIPLSSLSNGLHSWYVSCIDGIGNVGNSSNRSFNVQPPASSSSSKNKPLTLVLYAESCDKYVINATSSGVPLANVRVYIDDGKLGIVLYTDGNGQAFVPITYCGAKINAIYGTLAGHTDYTILDPKIDCNCAPLSKLRLSIAEDNCNLTKIQVTNGSAIVSNAAVTIKIPGKADMTQLTDASGFVILNKEKTDCNKTVTLSASASGYLSADQIQTIFDCSKCQIPECKVDADCPSGFICKNNKCEKKPQCTSNTDCAANAVCTNGNCLELNGCGITINHVFTPYECGSGPDCKVCPSGFICSANHTCISGNVSGPLVSNIGSKLVYTAQLLPDKTPCVKCTLELTDPTGIKTNFTTNENGTTSLLVSKKGEHKISLYLNGAIVNYTLTNVKESGNNEDNSLKIDPAVCGGLLLLLLIVAAVLYWRFKEANKK